MTLPSLNELAMQPTEDVEVAIRSCMPPGLALAITLTTQFEAQVTNAEGESLWAGYGPDRRVLLFNVYGYLLSVAGVKPSHPVWERRGEVQIPSRYGRLAYQGAVQIPDLDDLDGDEARKVYGIHTQKDSSK